MSKIRVYELAKELTDSARKVASKEIVEKAKELGISVENHLSQLDETEAARLKKALEQAQAGADGTETRVRRTVIRRRRGRTEDITPDRKGAVDEAEEPIPEAVDAPAEQEPVEEPAEIVEPAAQPAEAEEVVQEAPVEETAVEEPVAGESPEEGVEEAVETAVEAAAEVAAEVAEEKEEAPVVEDKPEVKEESAEAETPEPEAPVAEKTEVKAEKPKPRPRPTLVPTVRKKKKDTYKAIVVTMPEPDEVEKAPAVKPRLVRPSIRQLEAEDRARQPKRKGKKLIYDRRREGGGRYDRDGLRGGKRRRKSSHQKTEEEVISAAAQQRTIRIEDTITVNELAQQMTIKANVLLRKLVEQGVMTTLNDALDYDTAAIIAADLGYAVENVSFNIGEYLDADSGTEVELTRRPPVVTIMGHVDHGKTSLLDQIQVTDLAGAEAGGITQTIGAYVVKVNDDKIVFIDTPGHAAFTAMRARGAMVTDIVILVVAADDGVMPQTQEAIDHAKAADVPIIVAINKIDKPDADIERVKRELAERELLPEDWGGTTICVPLSAKTGDGLDSLLEMLVLQAEMLDLMADPNKRSKGIIIESKLEKGRGPVATVIVQEGTLRVGDIVVAGTASGRVRALLDDKGVQVDSVPPSMPAEIAGLDRVPGAGEMLHAVEDDKASKAVTDHLEKKQREERLAKQSKPSFEQLFSQLAQEGDQKVLKVVLKADSQGAVDAIRQGMEQLATEKVELEVIHEGVGVISENDVNLAQASDGFVLGFNVKPDPMAKALADSNNIQILTFTLIHELLDKTRLLMEGKLDLVEREVYQGKAEVRAVFGISKVGKIAGSHVMDGKIVRSGLARLHRGDEVVWKGKLSSLKRFKEDVREVAQGFECGIGLAGYDRMKEGDVIESYEIIKEAATL